MSTVANLHIASYIAWRWKTDAIPDGPSYERKGALSTSSCYFAQYYHQIPAQSTMNGQDYLGLPSQERKSTMLS